MPLLRRAWPPLAYLALSMLMTWPLVRHLGDGLPGLGDALLQAWTIAWDAHALAVAPASILDAPVFAPYPDTLAYTDNHLLLAALTAPLTWASGGPLLAHNLLVLLSFALSGWAVYLLARDTLAAAPAPAPAAARQLAAFVSGAAFAFCAYRFAHLTQLNLLQTAWMVFALVFLRRLLRPSDAGGGRLRDALLCGLFAGIQAITALYYSFFTAALLGGYALLWAALALWAHLRSGAPLPWRQLGLAALAAGLAGALALPFTLPYTRVFASLAIVRSPRELDNWSAPLRAYVSVTQSNLLYSRIGEAVVDSGEMVLFPGLLVALLALAGVGLIVRGAAGGLWRGAPVRPYPIAPLDSLFWLAVAAGALLLSLGTGLRLVRYDTPLPVPMPYPLLYGSVPGFGALRVPARWGLLVTLALSVLAALPLAAIFARRPRAHPPGAGASRPELVPGHLALGLAALAIVLVEQAAPPLQMPSGPALSEAPPIYAWLADPAHADAGAVLELPVAATPRGEELERITWRQWHGRLHWRPLVASYSGLIPFGTTDLLRHAEDLPAEEALSFLRLAGVSTLVVHGDEYDPAGRDALLAGLDASPQARRQAAVGADTVYALPPDPRLAQIEAAAGPDGAVFISGDERAPGVAALAVARRLTAAGHPLYGPGRPRYYQPLGAPRPGQVFAAGLLADAEDPRVYGFASGGLVWRGHGLALYRRDPALLASLSLAETVPGQFHPRYPATLELDPEQGSLAVGDRTLDLGGNPGALRVEIDTASTGHQTLDLGGASLTLPPGLSTVQLTLPPGKPLRVAGTPGQVALLRLRILASPAPPAAVTPEPGLAAAAEASLDGATLVVRALGAGADRAQLEIVGAAAYDDRPVRLVAGSQALPPGGEAVFAVDPLRPAAPWVSTQAEPVDGRYIVYLKGDEGQSGPGVPVAKFAIRDGQLADFEPVPLPLTAVR